MKESTNSIKLALIQGQRENVFNYKELFLKLILTINEFNKLRLKIFFTSE